MWEEKNNGLYKTFVFKNFKEAIAFMYHAMPMIDELNHHPEWSNIYNKVFVKLCTHDAGNTITEKDHQLAHLLDEHFNSPKN
ncbi:MAG: 4a-hydroxytetrahydrobiopterin dehydratase [Bacteroidetes bacterium]|nr:4a-hydroxytetrahydrobiopterin dehydratase [Bacteroidota bacterium]